jgi:tetratricopeptide (TPR) repeat protein
MRILQLLAVFMVLGLIAPHGAWGNGGGGGGGGMGTSPMPSRQMTPEERAKASFNQGVKLVKQADKTQQSAAEATKDDKKAKLLEQARKQYDKARQYFVGAVRDQAGMYDAWNYIGYTSRKLGDYNDSLAAYDEAIRLKPGFPDAIEYRGEAYLALNRIEDAKAAYMTLFSDARPLADQLMAAMQKWLDQRRTDASGVASGDIETFSQWIAERTAIAQQTASLAVDSPAHAAGAAWH